MLGLLRGYIASRSAKSWSFTFFYTVCLLFVLPVQGLLFFINLMSFNFSSALVNLMLCLGILFCWDFTNYLNKLEGKPTPNLKEVGANAVSDIVAEFNAKTAK